MRCWRWLCVFFLLSTTLLAGALPTYAAPDEKAQQFNVRDFGAKGDGKTKDTAALQKALDACAKNGGTVVIPSGVYSTGSIVLGANTTLRLERGADIIGSPDIEDYPLVRVRWEGEFAQGHRALICAEKADHIAIMGSGAIFGPPITLSRLRNPRGPCLIELTECKDVTLDGFSTQYQQLWSIHTLFCENVLAHKLTIRSINFNGDGIDVDSCRHVQIENCDINTGDDAIALKSGRGTAAMQSGRPTEDVSIKDCTLTSSGFAALAIGTEMSGGIRGVHVDNCTIAGHQNAIFIKSRDGRGGFIEDIDAGNLTVIHSPNFLAIDLVKPGIQASDPVTGETEKWARVHNLNFHDITVSGVGQLVVATNIPAQRPIDGLSISNVTGNCHKGITLNYVANARVDGIHVQGIEGPLVVNGQAPRGQ